MLRQFKNIEFVKDKFDRNILIIEKEDNILNFYTVKDCLELGYLEDNILYLNLKCMRYENQMRYLKNNIKYDFIEKYSSLD